jgi:hypothetical protein
VTALDVVPLPVDEQQRLAELEQVVERGLQTFVDVGLALLEIRDSRLYRATHATFEAYLDQRWKMSRSRGYRLIDSARLAELVSPVGDIPNERQARELAPLLRERGEAEVIDAWRELSGLHGDGVTEDAVRAVVLSRLNEDEPERPADKPWPGSSYSRRMRECLRNGRAAGGRPLNRADKVDRHVWRGINWCIKAAEADYNGATHMWELGQALLATGEPGRLIRGLEDPARGRPPSASPSTSRPGKACRRRSTGSKVTSATWRLRLSPRWTYGSRSRRHRDRAA